MLGRLVGGAASAPANCRGKLGNGDRQRTDGGLDSTGQSEGGSGAGGSGPGGYDGTDFNGRMAPVLEGEGRSHVFWVIGDRASPYKIRPGLGAPCFCAALLSVPDAEG